MIWLTGGRGMLGQQLAAEIAARGLPFVATDAEVDVTDRRALEKYSARRRFDWIVNCSGYTAVDRAESEREQALAVNALAVENLARLANERQAVLIHFSTDYVFAGTQRIPYREDDASAPLGYYGASKLEGEKRLLAAAGKYYLFRISWLYGVHGHNFVKTMLRLFRERERVAVVNDQIGSPTYARRLSDNIVNLIERNGADFGLYHYCDSGAVSWYDFACAIFDCARRKGWLTHPVQIEAITTAQYPTAAPRPAYSALNASKACQRLQFVVFSWQENLEEFFSEYRDFFPIANHE